MENFDLETRRRVDNDVCIEQNSHRILKFWCENKIRSRILNPTQGYDVGHDVCMKQNSTVILEFC